MSETDKGVTIAIDVDDVLANYQAQLNRFHNKTYGTNFKLRDYHSFKLWEIWGGTREEAIMKVHHFHTTQYFRDIKPRIGSLEAVDTLSQNHKLVVVTSRLIEIEQPTKDWIEKYYPSKFTQIYFTNHWALNNKTYRGKPDLCIDCGANVIIEDSLEYAKECSQLGIKAYLFKRPWNRTNERSDQIIKVRSWTELMRKILS